MQLFDTHFHYSGELPPRDYLNLLPEAAELRLLAVGGDYAQSRQAERFAGEIASADFAVGVHPHSAEEYLAAREDFSGFRPHPKLRAIGELGLDYYYDFAPRDAQRRVFEEFLALALAWELPAIVHCRDLDDRFEAYADCHALLRDFAAAGGRFVVHCFAGTPEWAERFLTLGGMLGVTGMVTFPRAENIRLTLRTIPDDRLLIETDAPYLAPVPFRGKPNHPGYLRYTAQRVATERNCPLEALAELTTGNAERFFARPARPEEAGK